MDSRLIIKRLTEDGVLLIPAGEKNKKAFTKWRELDSLSFLELIDLMEKTQTESVAAVLGKRSGGLFCIDVDTKHNAGFDAEIFRDLRELYPSLLDRMRVEKTPSGGYHLFYRCTLDGSGFSEYPKYGDVAFRWATEEELLRDPKRTKYCFLELKGEGDLSQIYPSIGYGLVGGEEIGTLSWSEHSSIVSLCYGYNEVIQEVTIREPKGSWVDIYDVNPYEHFNKSEAGAKILEERGWSIIRETGGIIYYEKPGRSKKETSATYHLKGNYYKVWTTDTELDAKAYSPSNLLCFFEYGTNVDAKKKLHAHLVSKGFGVIKPKIEERIVMNVARTGGELPANISFEGIMKYEEEKERYGQIYPFGVFWECNEDGVYSISRLRIIQVSGLLGIRIKNNDIVKINGCFIESIGDREYYDVLKDYIGEENKEEIYNCIDAFLQKSGKHIIAQLPILEDDEVIKSTKDIGYKGYKNGYVVIRADGHELLEWNTMDKLFWKHQIQNRDFIEGEIDGDYITFLDKCCGMSEHLKKCIGYYAHEYKSTMTSYIVVLCEMVENPRDGGGAGKNVFTNLLGFTTTLLNKPAKNVKFDDTLLRTWKNQKIFSLNDAEKSFDYLGLRELSSGEGEVGKKFVQEVTISNESMPKFIVNTNYSFDPSGPGLKRRLIPLEFTDFFIKSGGIDVYFGKNFPYGNVLGDWNEKDWIGFDNFIVECIRTFIAGGCKLSSPELTYGGWKKQFEQRFGALTFDFIESNIEHWLHSEVGGKRGYVDIVGMFNPSYEKFCNENNIDKKYRLSSIKMNDALQTYCDKHNIEFEKCKNNKANGIQSNVKIFIRKSREEDEKDEVEDVNGWNNYVNWENNENNYENNDNDEEFTLF